MLGEFEVSQMLQDVNEADPTKHSPIITDAERALQLMATQQTLNLILNWTEQQQRKWYKFVGRED